MMRSPGKQSTLKINFWHARLKRFVVMHDLGRACEQRTQDGAPFLKGLALTEAYRMVFQRFPPDQKQKILGMFDALAHLAFAKTAGAGYVRTRFGKGGFESLGLAWFHGDEGAFEDHNALRIFAAMG